MLLQEALEALNGGKKPHIHATGGTGEPWYTREAIILLDVILQPHFKAFEFGTGASTIWIAKRVKELIAIEHHSTWHQRVKTAIELAGLKDKVRLRKEALGAGYSEAINVITDGSLHAVFIDGRERPECTRNSIPKLKSQGILCIDNSDKERYSPGPLVDGWNSIITSNEKWQTTLWIKP